MIRLNVKCKTVKLPEESIGEILWPWFRQTFLRTQTFEPGKKKVILSLSKFKNFNI